MRIVIACALLFACQEPGQVPLRRDVVASLAEQVMLPTHAELEARASELPAAIDPLCAEPTMARLTAAQTAWRAVRVPLGRGNAFAFGPIDDEHIRTAIDFWPSRVESIDATLEMQVEPTPETIDALGVTSKGLPTIEYLLFDPVGGDAAVLAALDPATPEGAYRCSYVRALAVDVATRTSELHRAWADGFVRELAEESERYPTAQSAVDDVLNHLVFAVQDMTDMKLGRPLGDKTGGVPQPDIVQSRFSDNALADLGSDLEGASAVWIGAEGGLGLGDAVASRNAALDSRVRDQIDVATQSVASLTTPLRLAVVDDPAPVEAARADIRELRRLLEVDVANVLGVTITLNDNDGD